MARRFNIQAVVYAALLALLACSQFAMADSDDSDQAAESSRRYQIKQPVRKPPPQKVRQASTVQPDDDVQQEPIARGEGPPGPWSEDEAAEPLNGALPSCMPQCDQCGGTRGCCRCCLCGPPGRFWVRDEYLSFWTKGDNLPVLVTTSPTGALPLTQPVFGGNAVNTGYRPGNWIQGGMWLDCCRQWAIQGDYFFLGQQSTNFNQASDGNPALGRPFTDATNGVASQQLIAFPGTVVGGVNINDTNSFSGAGAMLRHNLCCKTYCPPCNDGCGSCFQGQNCCRLDFLTGFRYYNFSDNLNISENLTSTSTTSGVPVGTLIQVNDSFRTTNNFYGGSLGLVVDKYRNRWVLENTAIVTLGTNAQRIFINGNTTTSFPGTPTSVAPGGLYALSSNIGNYSHNSFTAIPQFSTRLGYRLTQNLTAFVGYTFIYWGNVATAGNQVDTTVNPNLLPPAQPGATPLRPAFMLHETSFWAQGITLGGQLNF